MKHIWIRLPFVGLVMGGVALWCTRRRLFPKFKKCGLVQPLQVVYFSIYGGLFVGSGLIGMLGLKRGEWLLFGVCCVLGTKLGENGANLDQVGAKMGQDGAKLDGPWSCM